MLWRSRQHSRASARQAGLLDARPGERVLDLGCGPGTDLALFAGAVGDGLAIGIDRSHAMAVKAAVDEAVARAAGGPFDRAVEDAVADGAVTSPEGQAYLSRLQWASDRGAFCFAVASVVAGGRRPH